MVMEVSKPVGLNAAMMPTIEWNYEALRAEVEASAKRYETLVYTEDQYKDMKSDVASLRKLKEALDNERKRYKAIYLEKFTIFENQIKDILAVIDKPIGLIDGKIKDVEAQRVADKKATVEKTYLANIGELAKIVPFERLWEKQYENLTPKVEKVQEAVAAKIAKIREDLVLIEGLGSSHVLALKDLYVKQFDISGVLAENNRLIALDKQFAEAEEKKKSLAAEAAARKEAEQADESGNAQGYVKAPRAAMSASFAPSHATVASAEEKTVTVDFRVVTTAKKLDSLKAFLKENGIKFGPVPKEGQ